MKNAGFLKMRCAVSIVFALLPFTAANALPIFDVTESVGGGIGEFTAHITSPVGESWHVLMFAAENDQSVLAGGDGAFVDNGIGQWTGMRFAPNQWQSDFAFEFDTPGGVETIISTLGFGNFVDLFGSNTFALAYWPTSYLDFSTGGTFSLIGPTESRGGFKFHTTIAASNWVALVQNDSGDKEILTGSVVPPPPPPSVPEPGMFGLLVMAIAGMALRKKQLLSRAQVILGKL